MRTIIKYSIMVLLLFSLTMTAQRPGDTRHMAGNKNKESRREWKKAKKVKQNGERHLKKLQHYAVTEAKNSLNTRLAGIQFKKRLSPTEKKGVNGNAGQKKEPFLNRIINKFKKHKKEKEKDNPK